MVPSLRSCSMKYNNLRQLFDLFKGIVNIESIETVAKDCGYDVIRSTELLLDLIDYAELNTKQPENNKCTKSTEPPPYGLNKSKTLLYFHSKKIDYQNPVASTSRAPPFQYIFYYAEDESSSSYHKIVDSENILKFNLGEAIATKLNASCDVDGSSNEQIYITTNGRGKKRKFNLLFRINY